MDYYLLKDGEVEEEDMYQMFNKWCKQEGVIMPKLEYPVFFDGVKGMRAKEQIKHREVFIYVPYKMMLTVRKA